VNEGSKGVLLGLGDAIRALPAEFRGSLPAGATRAEPFCPGCLVVEGPAYLAEVGFAARVARHPDFSEWPLLVVVDDARAATRTPARFLWTTFTRFEPAADIHAKEVGLLRNHAAFTMPVSIDARTKPTYPRELLCDPATAQIVTRRWREYFPGGQVEMGDSDAGHLDAPGG
jgi:hypothetical protein